VGNDHPPRFGKGEHLLYHGRQKVHRGLPGSCDDPSGIGPIAASGHDGDDQELLAADNQGEIERLLARIQELEHDTRRLETENVGLRSEVAELKATRTLDPLAWSKASPHEREDFLAGIEWRELRAAIPPAWGLEGRMLRAVSTEKIFGELERRLPPNLWKKHKAAITAVCQALESSEQHAGPILDLEVIRVSDPARVEH
jgi:hypothetical protein